ncbi:hypothetical protein [Rufibacter roseolus]|uniref:hypothetical protein n=1 Tax=Rufibacter roseolus TaxID=2817375 RepID=UPI001B31264D|nr:hypothetical protein [Rufibacter roseolus]
MLNEVSIPFQNSVTKNHAAVTLQVAEDFSASQVQTPMSHQVEYHIENAKSLLHLANELKKFIVEQKLAANIQGKQYVMVEGWQFAGSMLGLCCILNTKSLEDLSSGNELRFRVSASVYRVSSGKLVASAYASCSNKEKGQESFAAYAVESMTQTRAISKAYRTYLAWLVKAAGFEATPYEEMPLEEGYSVNIATEPQYEKIAMLASSHFITPQDLSPDVKRAIQQQTLTDQEAKEVSPPCRILSRNGIFNRSPTTRICFTFNQYTYGPI